MPENLLDDLGLMSLDEGDDLHLGPAPRTQERVSFVDLLDQGGPAFAGLARRGRVSWEACPGRGRWLCLGSLTPALYRLQAGDWRLEVTGIFLQPTAYSLRSAASRRCAE